jgi:predicted nucleic acid-binding protein
LKYLLDTNVLSELRKGIRANPSVRKWWSETDSLDVCVSVLVLGEIRQGIERLKIRNPDKAQEIERWLESIPRMMGTRLLVVNHRVADVWGRMGVKRTLPLVDSLLAATAVAHDLTLVTRNTKDITDTGARYLNPFESVDFQSR